MKHTIRRFRRDDHGWLTSVGRGSALLALAALATACGSSTSSPTPPAIDVSGTWAGARTYEYTAVRAPASNDCQYMEGDTFTIQQSGTSLSGTLAIHFHLLPGSVGTGELACATDNVCTGPFTGSIHGSQVELVLPGQNCFNDILTFDGTVNGSTMGGTVSPNPGIFVNGSLSVTERYQPWKVMR